MSKKWRGNKNSFKYLSDPKYMRKNKFTRFYSSTSKIDATQFFLVIFKLFDHLILYPTTLNLVNIGTRNYFIITHTHTSTYICAQWQNINIHAHIRKHMINMYKYTDRIIPNHTHMHSWNLKILQPIHANVSVHKSCIFSYQHSFTAIKIEIHTPSEKLKHTCAHPTAHAALTDSMFRVYSFLSHQFHWSPFTTTADPFAWGQYRKSRVRICGKLASRVE